MQDDRSSAHDIVIYGASGFTGRLVAEYLAGLDNAPNWAMAGRNAGKLEQVRAEIGAGDVPIVIASADDPQSLADMARSARVIISTVGPYQLYGEALLAACARHGTDYLDLCGEPTWMRQMIDAYGDKARASGARIIFSSGFDSIPFDCGVYMLQQQMIARFGHPAQRVRGRVRVLNGTFSGGTAASLNATLAAAADDKELLSYLTNPFSLAGGFEGPEQPRGDTPHYEDDLQSWAAPFIMATINTKNIHRTNALLKHEYGTDFVYDEMMLTGDGERGEQAAKYLAESEQLGGDDAPAPGEGPSLEERENGNYDVLFIGEDDQGNRLHYGVTGDKDPGYGSTCKIISQAAICLLENDDCPGGFWTPAAAMGEALVERLVAHAGLTFELEEKVNA